MPRGGLVCAAALLAVAATMACGGASSGGSSANGGATGEACLDNPPCSCANGAQGFARCVNDASECICPDPATCPVSREPEAPCFEPCGGDPLGVWQLSYGCYAAREVQGSSCPAFQDGEMLRSYLTLELRQPDPTFAADTAFIDGVESWRFWTIYARECGPCRKLTAQPTAMLFGILAEVTGVLDTCAQCDCPSGGGASVALAEPHQVNGNLLTIGAMDLPFCVKGDQLWIGGGEKVAYMFTRRP